MENYKIIIAGGRHFDNYELLKAKCDYFLSKKIQTHDVIIVSGHASGADSLGERYAHEHGLKIELHPADWDAHGRAAGPIRNAEMAECSDALIAFWDGVWVNNCGNTKRQRTITDPCLFVCLSADATSFASRPY